MEVDLSPIELPVISVFDFTHLGPRLFGSIAARNRHHDHHEESGA